jgi:hypothetical protein
MDTNKVTIHITLDSVWWRLVVLTLVVVGLTGSVAQALDENGQAPSGNYAPLLQSSGGRGFYLTPNNTFQGDDALTACAAGYHMASLWEIYDVSNLAYDTVLGYTGSDSGEGPPTNMLGWVRTGYHTADGDATPGIGNCLAWTSNSATDHGTVVMIGYNWTLTGTAISPWQAIDSAGLTECSDSWRVWCVED